jgi:endonuclease YncB( thermonuclease family)
VERGTQLFWLLIVGLLGASFFFGFNAASRRRAVRSTGIALATGQIVRLAQVADGDSIVVTTEGGESASVRLLGIKAFDAAARDESGTYGRLAVERLRRLLEDRPARLFVADPPTDKHGRTIAEVFVENENVGMTLVREGLVLVYTVYPFPAMSTYLEVQSEARADRKGLFGDPRLADRATLLAREWGRSAE